MLFSHEAARPLMRLKFDKQSDLTWAVYSHAPLHDTGPCVSNLNKSDNLVRFELLSGVISLAVIHKNILTVFVTVLDVK